MYSKADPTQSINLCLQTNVIDLRNSRIYQEKADAFVQEIKSNTHMTLPKFLRYLAKASGSTAQCILPYCRGQCPVRTGQFQLWGYCRGIDLAPYFFASFVDPGQSRQSEFTGQACCNYRRHFHSPTPVGGSATCVPAE